MCAELMHNIVSSTVISPPFFHHENFRGRSSSVTTNVGANSCKALNLLLAVSSALVLAPNIDSAIESGSLATRQSSVALPKAKITFWNGANCKSVEGLFPKAEVSNVASGTCQRASTDFGFPLFGSAIAEADVPSGFNCTLRLHTETLCINGGNNVIARGAPNVCVSTNDFGALTAFWECVAPPPPEGYPPVNVTLSTLPGCLLSGAGVVSYTYPIEANACLRPAANLLSTFNSGKVVVSTNQPIVIAPGYKCELVLYSNALCDPRFGAPAVGRPGECVNRFARAVKWQCGPV
jgi:hypothetical protein